MFAPRAGDAAAPSGRHRVEQPPSGASVAVARKTRANRPLLLLAARLTLQAHLTCCGTKTWRSLECATANLNEVLCVNGLLLSEKLCTVCLTRPLLTHPGTHTRYELTHTSLCEN